ncbi:MAG TPA: ribbon-helix-helix protein, CopG family [Candidatus Thermoplasmatota archaeon]|nr:ribbon-helix-helix protein, CopG family [Candidatus Thermoplasmatota archaeon]
MPVETERVTLRLPKNDIALLESLVAAGEFMSISEAIRAAIRDMVRSRAPKVAEGIEARKAIHASADAAKELEELRAAIEEMQRRVSK